jgi:uncharacterized repeat protein (TIGR01451 family)
MLYKFFLLLIGFLLSSQALAGTSTLYAVSPYSGDSTTDGGLIILNPITGVPLSAIDITYNGVIIQGANGLAIDPTTGTAYTVIKTANRANGSMRRTHKGGQGRGGGTPTRGLATLDLNTGVATLIADLGDNFAGITFGCTGQMYGVTGDGATVSESVFLIDKTNASTTILATLGDGSDGETIGYNTDNGLLYTRSGRDTNSAFTSIDPVSGVTTAIGGTTLDEAFSMLWDSDNNYFLEANLDSEWISTETNGTQAILDPTGYPGFYKGLAWVPAKGCAPPEADLSITKTDGVITAIPGASLAYTIVASNAGPGDDPTVSVTDTFPAGLTCSYTSVNAGGATGNTAAGSGNLVETLSMPNGSSVTYTATCDIASDATGTLSNTATISGSVTDPQLADNSATDDDTVLSPEADLSITKTDNATSAIPGGSLTYTIVASNIGPSDDPTVSVTDTFPAGLTCTHTSVNAGGATGNTAGSGNLAETLGMPNGSSVTYTASCDIDSDATGTLSNTATISGSVIDPQAGNNSATDSDTALTPDADLSIVITAPTNVSTPGPITYTIDVSNSGPSDATNVIVTDVLDVNFNTVQTVGCLEDPNGYPGCNLGTLVSGAMSSYAITFEVGSVNGAINNNASVTSDATDINTANNASAASIFGTPIVVPTLNKLGLLLAVLMIFSLGMYLMPKRRL